MEGHLYLNKFNAGQKLYINRRLGLYLKKAEKT